MVRHTTSRRLQYSLAALFIASFVAFVVLVSVGRFVWWRVQTHQIKKQIWLLGGSCRRSLVEPWWALTIESIEAVEFRGHDIGDKELQRAIPMLLRLPKLKVLLLNDSDITPASFDELQRLPHLEYVDLTGTQVSLADVQRLYERIPNLRKVKYVEVEAAPGKKVLQMLTS